jgi:hypothetical protein
MSRLVTTAGVVMIECESCCRFANHFLDMVRNSGFGGTGAAAASKPSRPSVLTWLRTFCVPILSNRLLGYRAGNPTKHPPTCSPSVISKCRLQQVSVMESFREDYFQFLPFETLEEIFLFLCPIMQVWPTLALVRCICAAPACAVCVFARPACQNSQ